MKLRFVTSKLTSSGVATGAAAEVLVGPKELCSDAVLRCAVLGAELGIDGPVNWPGSVLWDDTAESMPAGTPPVRTSRCKTLPAVQTTPSQSLKGWTTLHPKGN